MTRPPSPLLARLSDLATLDAVAVVDDEGVTTHRALAERSVAVAGGLLALLDRLEQGPSGAASLAGRRVALLASPGAAWVAAFFGILRAGGVAVPLSPLHPEAETRYFVDDADAWLVLVDASMAPRASWFGDRRVVALDALPPPRLASSPSEPSIGADDTALMLYTSGTTGKPKGACITHANVATQARLLGEWWAVSPRDRLLHALPLHHLHGLGISLLTTLLSGASARMLPRFEAARFWRELPSCTVMMAVPTMYHRLFEALDHEPDAATRRALVAGAAGLRLATSGSAALPVTLARRWRELTGVIPLERFGMTEIGVGAANPLQGERREGTVGVPLPTVSLRVVDDAGRDVEPGQPGEIRVRGPSVFSGYFGRESATAAAFSDGWFLTGDTATIDESGYVKILGRTSVDILKSGGYKLSALEIEEALRLHEAVAEVAVVGVPDPAWGDRVVAVLVPRPGQAVDADALRAFCRAHLAPYKIPREFVAREALPRNALGKVVKPELLRSLLSPTTT